MTKTDTPDSQRNRVESRQESPFNRLENTARLNAQDKTKLVETLTKDLAKLPAADVLRGLVKTLEKTGIKKDNSEQIRGFLNKMPKSLIIFLQKTLQKAGYKISFKRGKQVISGPRACDGDWGEASQGAWFDFLRHEQRQRSKESYATRANVIETRLQNIVTALPENSLPQGFQKNGKLTPKGAAVLKVLALADAGEDNNVHGLLFSTESDNTETSKITAAIKTLFPIVKVGVTYRAQRDYDNGLSPDDRAISLNGYQIILWGAQATRTASGPKEKMRTLSPEEKKIFLSQEYKFFKNELKKMRTEILDCLNISNCRTKKTKNLHSNLSVT